MLEKLNISQYILDKFIPAKLPEHMLQLVFVDDTAAREQTVFLHAQQRCPDLIYPFSQWAHPAELLVKHARKLVALNVEKRIKKVLEITLNMQNFPNLSYVPGDTIGILPINSTVEVQELLAALDLTNVAHNCCQIRLSPTCTKKSAKVPSHIPANTTPYELLCYCVNIRAVLKKQFLRALGENCSVVTERNFFNCLSSKEGHELYDKLILKEGLTLLDLLKLCTSCRPKLEMILEHLPRLLPRPYSIANSPLSSDQEIKIIFSILLQKPGVTTKMLEDFAEQLSERENCGAPKVLAYLRETNQFRFTEENAFENDQILIAIGTGLAPFIGFLEHKQELAKTSIKKLGRTWLFAGAPTEDSILYREKFLAWHKEGLLTKYFESCSRMPDVKYRYVQMQLEENSHEFVEFLQQPKTILYVCADGAQVSKSIEEAVKNCLKKELEISDNDISSLIKNYRLNGKYREDLWA